MCFPYKSPERRLAKGKGNSNRRPGVASLSAGEERDPGPESRIAADNSTVDRSVASSNNAPLRPSPNHGAAIRQLWSGAVGEGRD
jgi:hypothetical protein